MPLGPNVRQSVVDLPLRANRNEGHLTVDKLNVVILGWIVRIGKTDQPTRFDDKKVVLAVNVLRERFSGSQLEIPHAHAVVLQHQSGPNKLGWFSRHSFTSI